MQNSYKCFATLDRASKKLMYLTKGVISYLLLIPINSIAVFSLGVTMETLKPSNRNNTSVMFL